MKRPTTIQCKRVYDAVARQDGYRVLVDQMWPRGVSKDALELDDWQKSLAPSTELRQWFGHDPQRWAGFYQRYHKELENRQEELRALQEHAAGRPLTLLYAAKDRDHNNAVALKMLLEGAVS